MKLSYAYKAPLLLAMILAVKYSANGQHAISGRIIGADSIGIARATLALYHTADSATVRTIASDTNGIYRFTGIVTGKYFIAIECVGYKKFFLPDFNIHGGNDIVDLGTTQLHVNGALLKEVSVLAQAKAMEQKDGKLIVNLKNSVTSSGSSVLEILERIPSVTVNAQSNVFSIKGREGAIVMINGKRNYMPPGALFQFLAGLSADNIDRIELIGTPGSEMDAEGKAGFINIILKKGKNEGLYGNLGLQAGYGVGSLANLNGDVTYIRGRISLSGNYSFSRNTQDQLSFNFREKNAAAGYFSSNTNSDRHPVQTNHNLYFGINYQVSANTSIGGALSAYTNKWAMDALNHTEIISAQGNAYIEIPNDEINHWKHLGGNLNIRHLLKNNRVLSASIDYLYYKDDNPANYNQKYYNEQGQILDQKYTRSTKQTPISILVGKIDYTFLSDKKWTVETGAKTSVSKLDNNVAVNALQQGVWVPDNALTSVSSLQEKIIALYGTATYNISEKSNVKAGFRYEYTNYEMLLAGKQNRNFGNLFPSIIINHKLNSRSAITLSYSKRINRPSFTDVAPFVLFIDPYTLFTGNPAVQASTSHHAGVDYSLGKVLISSVYTTEANALSKFQISTDTGRNIQIIRPENLSNLKSFNTTIIIPFTVCSFWNMQNSFSGLWQEVHKGYSLGGGILTKWSFQVSSTQSFKLPKKFSFEISGFYNSAVFSGTSDLQRLGGLSAGLRKSFGKSVITVNYTDILNTVKYTFLVNNSGYFIRNGFDFSHPTIKIGYAYKFGSSVQGAKIKNSNSAEDERRRVE